MLDRYFAPDYAAARNIFLAACREADVGVTHHAHPLSRQNAAELSLDVARIGPRAAQRLLILQSGVHGPELMCGSGCQVGLLREGVIGRLGEDTAVLLVHAVNPWGAAYGHRYNEDNVDLCRNFLDFDQPLPGNPAYEKLRGVVEDVAGCDGDLLMQRLRDAAQKAQIAPFVAPLMMGQYRHPRGFGYGGSAPTWSNQVMTRILDEHAATATRVAVIDFHSGLGDYGEGTVVVMHDGADLERARRWFGSTLVAPREGSGPDAFFPVRGHCSDGFQRSLPRTELTYVTLEFGTFSMERNFAALLEDYCVSRQDDPGCERVAAAYSEMLTTHNPDDATWRRKLWRRAVEVCEQAIACLQRE
ncbi:MAG: DUF2817 domain-containing protein [Steroidobacteraceae bacterium]